MVAFFGVIIAVNVTMATIAIASWTGLVVQNSYVASQEFETQAPRARGAARRRLEGDASATRRARRELLVEGRRRRAGGRWGR